MVHAPTRPPAAMAELWLSVRILRPGMSLNSQRLQNLVLLAFPESVRTYMHNATPKAYTFAYRAADERAGVLRLTTLAPHLTQIALAGLPDQVDLRAGSVSLAPFRPARSVGYSTVARLLERPADRRLPLEARTPTRLGAGGDRPLPLPLPWALFAEPVKCWAAYSGLAGPPDELADWQRQHVALSAFAIRSATLEVEGQAEPGFVGAFELTVTPGLEQSPEWRWTHLLAHYARFTGAGRRRARGAGQLVPGGLRLGRPAHDPSPPQRDEPATVRST